MSKLDRALTTFIGCFIVVSWCWVPAVWAERPPYAAGGHVDDAFLPAGGWPADGSIGSEYTEPEPVYDCFDYPLSVEAAQMIQTVRQIHDRLFINTPFDPCAEWMFGFHEGELAPISELHGDRLISEGWDSDQDYYLWACFVDHLETVWPLLPHDPPIDHVVPGAVPAFVEDGATSAAGVVIDVYSVIGVLWNSYGDSIDVAGEAYRIAGMETMFIPISVVGPEMFTENSLSDLFLEGEAGGGLLWDVYYGDGRNDRVWCWYPTGDPTSCYNGCGADRKQAVDTARANFEKARNKALVYCGGALLTCLATIVVGVAGASGTGGTGVAAIAKVMIATCGGLSGVCVQMGSSALFEYQCDLTLADIAYARCMCGCCLAAGGTCPP